MKIGRFAYYVGNPVRRVCQKIKSRVRKVTDKLTGRWWCDGCGAYHHGRVIGFYMCAECDGVCGKHITPEEVQKCETITVGGYFGRDITERVKMEFRKQEGSR